jgi:putative Holliday junction resolvase
MKSNFFGLDVGEKTIGIAFSQGFFAQPLTTLTFEVDDYHRGVDALVQLIEKHHVNTIVIGLPKHLSNELGVSAQRALHVKELLEAQIDKDIIMWDERLTTKEAERRMLQFDVSRKKRKQRIDQVAAVILLQSYLDRIQR